jgi:hypothetical protein
MKKLENILAENMHRFKTKNLTEDMDQNNNGYPDGTEGSTNAGKAQLAFNKLYDLTDEFGGDYPLNFYDDNLPSNLESISDKFFEDDSLLTAAEDVQLAKFIMQCVKELKNELRYG